MSFVNWAPNDVIIMSMVEENIFNEEAGRKGLGISSNSEAFVIEKQREVK